MDGALPGRVGVGGMGCGRELWRIDIPLRMVAPGTPRSATPVHRCHWCHQRPSAWCVRLCVSARARAHVCTRVRVRDAGADGWCFPPTPQRTAPIHRVFCSESCSTPNRMYIALINDAIVATKQRSMPSATRVVGEHAPASSPRVVPAFSSSSSSRLRTSSYAACPSCLTSRIAASWI